VFEAMGNKNATTAGTEKGRHPFMHRTQTIDYAVVLKGEITMLLDDQDVVLKEGDVVKSGTLLAEIETDKATMEFEAVDEGRIGKILVAEGTEGVKVNAPIATLLADGTLYASDNARALGLAARSALIDDELLVALERWETLGSSATV
jgi:hypothetical protein